MAYIADNNFEPFVLVIVGHTQDTSAIIRRTESPVILTDGINIAGFARQHIVRQFRYPGSSVFGLFTVRFPLTAQIACWLDLCCSFSLPTTSWYQK